MVEMVYVSIQVHVVAMVVQLIQENVQRMQIILNAVIVYLAQLMEKQENVYFPVNVVVKV